LTNAGHVAQLALEHVVSQAARERHGAALIHLHEIIIDELVADGFRAAWPAGEKREREREPAEAGGPPQRGKPRRKSSGHRAASPRGAGRQRVRKNPNSVRTSAATGTANSAPPNP